MSRIGKAPIPVPSGVEVTINGTHVAVKGPKGSLAWSVPDDITVTQDGDTLTVHGRFDGEEVRLERTPGSKLRYAGKGFDIRLDLDDPLGSVEGQADGAVDLRWLRSMDLIRMAVADPQANNFISTGLLLAGATTP